MIQSPDPRICCMRGRCDLSGEQISMVDSELHRAITVAGFAGCSRFITLMDNPVEALFVRHALQLGHKPEVWIISRHQLAKILKDPETAALLRRCYVHRERMPLHRFREWCIVYADHNLSVRTDYGSPYPHIQTLTNDQ